MNSATSSLLEKLNKINDENAIAVFVPSASKEIKFKTLNIKQQKNLIKTAMDGAAAGATLNQQLNDIIITNSSEKIDFKVYDRYAIIIALRIATIGEIINSDKEEINLSKVLKQNIKKYKQKVFDHTSEIDYHKIKVSLELPALEKDSKINDKFIKFAKMRENNENYGDAIGNLYVYEIVKFIKSIQIKGETDIYNFDSLNIKDCFDIVENLPVGLNTKIIEYIESVREIENSFLETENGNVEINAAFFSKA